jgi:ribosomal-protein-alanine N-acetyltransferase
MSSLFNRIDRIPSQTYDIRPATNSDIFAIRRLEVLVFRRDAYSYLNLTSLLMWPGAANFKAVDIGDRELVGFISGTPNWGTKTDWIVTLGVHPDHQRKHLGRRLLEVAENALSLPYLRLTVRRSNLAAIHLYESAGYSSLYIEPRYYDDGEDGIIMQKTRPEPPDPVDTDDSADD